MARFLGLWHINPSTPMPTDPSELLELEEKMWAIMDGMKKSGALEDWGVFPEAHVGYCIGKGETADIYRTSLMFSPHVVFEAHEIISYEKHKEITRAFLKSQIAAMKKTSELHVKVEK